MFWVHSDSVEPKVLHVLCHCYAAINIFIKIFKVIITFSYIGEPPSEGFPKKAGKGKTSGFFLICCFCQGTPSFKKNLEKNILRIEDGLFSQY